MRDKTCDYNTAYADTSDTPPPTPLPLPPFYSGIFTSFFRLEGTSGDFLTLPPTPEFVLETLEFFRLRALLFPAKGDPFSALPFLKNACSLVDSVELPRLSLPVLCLSDVTSEIHDETVLAKPPVSILLRGGFFDFALLLCCVTEKGE